jgi:hypothetical protein
MMSASDFTDEDTEVAPEPRERRDGGTRTGTLTSGPRCELIWVEEAGYGMILRVRPIPSS